MFCVAGGDISLAWAHRWLIPIPGGRKGSAPASPSLFESEVCVCCCLSPYMKRCCPQLLSGMATDRGATHLGKKWAFWEVLSGTSAVTAKQSAASSCLR